jgi:hypothetical protein
MPAQWSLQRAPAHVLAPRRFKRQAVGGFEAAAQCGDTTTGHGVLRGAVGGKAPLTSLTLTRPRGLRQRRPCGGSAAAGGGLGA